MRKVNAFLGIAIIILLLLHGISGAFQLIGIIPGGNALRQGLSWLMVSALALHAFIGVKLTIDTLKAIKKSGASYFRENKLFWIRRISGFAIIVFAIYHVCIFMSPDGEDFRLALFEGGQLAGSLLLVLSVCLHVLSNIKPLMISFGADKARKFIVDILFVLVVAMLLCAVAFVVYYLRWNVLWRTRDG
ncbi:MAG: hypothetical protein ACTTJZ_05820 [Sphaerochaetaceae bacterium]